MESDRFQEETTATRPNAANEGTPLPNLTINRHAANTGRGAAYPVFVKSLKAAIALSTSRPFASIRSSSSPGVRVSTSVLR